MLIDLTDSIHYLGLVNNNSSADYLGGLQYFDGSKLSEFNINYDFQSYYVFWGMIIKALNFLNIIFNNYNTFAIGYYIWASGIVFYILFFALFCETIKVLNINNYIIIFLIFLFPFLWFVSHPLTSSLPFIGNIYRIIFTSYIIIEIYYNTIYENYSLKSSLIISFLICCSIAHSSSSLFICFIMIIPYITKMIQLNIRDLELNFLVLVLP